MEDISSPQSTPSNNHQIGSLVERLRSYESDMAKLKGIRLEPKQPTAPKPVAPTQIPQPIQPNPIAGKPQPVARVESNIIETLKASNAVVPPTIKKEDPQKTIQALHKDTPVPAIHTLQTDAQEVIRREPVQTAVPSRPINTPASQPIPSRVIIAQPKNHTTFIMIAGVVIIGSLIGVSAYVVINRKATEIPAVVTTPIETPKPVIEEGKQKIIIAENQSIIGAINQAKSEAQGKNNSFVSLSFTEGQSSAPLTIDRFIKLLSNTTEPWFNRSLTQYYAALHRAPTGWQPIFIFKTDAYENAYAGMLRWETTIGQELTGTTATSTTKFKDIVINNHDVRALEDARGNRSVFYTFVGTSTLVITTNQNSLEETFARFGTSK